MSYRVLAREWRPKNFQEMVGQEHVLRALINALDENRLHHAYLFTGTRGVGKTTLARVVAKSLNCETGVSATPCGHCVNCTEIDQGRFVDLIEVDAASRTKVEDTRELLDNVQYAPTRGRYKVYLIDEVHMLSTSSFNALLKTLEEPPPHIQFLLATTDPQKLPATVLSRCLQFNLKQIPIEHIIEFHQRILQAENIPYDILALKHLARAAAGSMRDSLSLLDQAIVFCGGEVRENDVASMLGYINNQCVEEIIDALARQSATDLMAVLQRLSDSSPDYMNVLDKIMALLHQLAIAKRIPEGIDDVLFERETVLQLASRLSEEDIQLYYQIALMGKKDLPLVPDPKSGLEMTLLRMLAFYIDRGSAEQGVHEMKVTTASSGHSRSVTQKADAIRPNTESADAEKIQSTPKDTDLKQDNGTCFEMISGEEWGTLLDQLKLAGLTDQLARNCSLTSWRQGRVELVLDMSSASLNTSMNRTRLQEALAKFQKQPVKLKIVVGERAPDTPAQIAKRVADEEHVQAVEAIAEDPYINKMQSMFGASVVNEMTKPV